MDKHNKSGSKSQEGHPQHPFINTAHLKSIKEKRQQFPSSEDLISKILSSDMTSLSRAITLIESTNSKHCEQANTLIKGCLPYANNSIRIGITGVPGVGKSTFIESFGTYLTKLNKKVAVLAIDPSSSLTKGSILGDKTRMEDLVKKKNAFVRPSASGGSLGGVARKTREAIILCEAAGFNIILVETVGVGQSEIAVHSMVDFFLLMKLAGAGDELQGIKRGIIEMADSIVINKADGDNLINAKLAKVEFENALHLYPKKMSQWQPKVTLCSALKDEGISNIWEDIETYHNLTKNNAHFSRQRHEQNKFWLMQTIKNQLHQSFFNDVQVQKELKSQLKLLEQNKTSPFAAAEYILNL